METINIEKLLYTDFCISDIVILNQYWHENQIYRTDVPRVKSGFLYFCGCCGEYTIDGKTMSVGEKSIVYLPPGTEYSTRFYKVRTDCPTSIVMNFNFYDEDKLNIKLSDEIVELCSAATVKIENIINNAGFWYSLPVTNFAAVKKNMFALIEELASFSKANSLSKNEFVRIKKGIEYLEFDAEQKLSIGEIAALCNVSETYFRKLFFKYADMSPNKFRLSKKIEKAKLYLEDGAYNVSEVAECLGFADSSYFCRIFKKHTGMSPHVYIKRKKVSFFSNTH